MQITFEACGEQIIFRVAKFEPQYVPVLQMCFYQADGDSYIKYFAKQIPNLDKIMAYYARHAEAMFSQLGYFTAIPWEDALYAFVTRIAETNIDWWLTGSCAACIRGIPLQPHDVDIMVAAQDIPVINELFADYVIEPIIDTQGWVTKDFGVLFWYARIDIASDPQVILDQPEPADCGPYAKQHLETCIWRGTAIRVPPLQLQLNVNRRRGRTKRAQLIEEFLRTTQK
jgi:hypothetical protein